MPPNLGIQTPPYLGLFRSEPPDARRFEVLRLGALVGLPEADVVLVDRVRGARRATAATAPAAVDAEGDDGDDAGWRPDVLELGLSAVSAACKTSGVASERPSRAEGDDGDRCLIAALAGACLPAVAAAD